MDHQLKRLICLFFALCLATVNPAQAAWPGSGRHINAGAGGIGTLVLTQVIDYAGFTSGGNSDAMTVDSPIGSSIFLFTAVYDTNVTMSSCGDSAGNTYTAIQAAAASNVGPAEIFYSLNVTHDLPVGGTIHCTTSSGNPWIVEAYKVANLNVGIDISKPLNTNTTGTSISQSTGTLAQASEMLINYCQPNSVTSITAPTSPWTTLRNDNSQVISYDIVAATTTVTAAVSWSPTAFSSCILASFKH